MQVALVDVVDVGDHLLEGRRGLAPVRGGVAQPVLGGGDLVVDRRRRVALGVDAERVGAALGQTPRVGLVVDRELARVAEPLGLGAQDARAGGVERHQPHPPRAVPEQPLDALAHLAGRLVRERDRQDLAGLRLVGVDQEGDPVGEHARLAAAGAREDQQRPLAVRDGLPLGLVEPLEQLLEVLGVRVLEHLDPSIDADSAGARGLTRARSPPRGGRVELSRARGGRRAPPGASRRPGSGP